MADEKEVIDTSNIDDEDLRDLIEISSDENLGSIRDTNDDAPSGSNIEKSASTGEDEELRERKSESSRDDGGSPSRKKSNLEKRLRAVDESIDERNKSLFASTFSVFYPAYYDEVEIPEEAIQVDEYGDECVVPQVVKPWVCKYYYQPERKARLARHSALAAIIVLFSIVALFNGIPGGIGAMILGVLLLLNFQFRFRDIAVWKWPMPEIPYLSDLDLGERINEAERRSAEIIREREEYERMVEEGRDSTVIFIDPVDNYRDGNPSPATILTNWMNVSAQMDRDEFIEASDGKLNNFTMNLILEDNEGAWKDPTILDTVSFMTNTNAQDWLDAYELWSASEEI